MNAKLKTLTPVTPKVSALQSLFPDMNKSGRNLWMFDDFLEGLFDDFNSYQTEITFPKYNVKFHKDTGDGIIEIALAGYDKSDINVELTPENKLRVSNVKTENNVDREDDWVYTKNGIASRDFSISWKLSPYQEVGDVEFVNGILTIKINNTEPPKPETKYLKIK
jgi:HSP20 family molecular chaperone IbpA